MLQSPIAMKTSFYLGLLILPVLLLGCQQREIQVYTAAKDLRAVAQSEPASAAPPTWTVPEHWVSQPTTAFRVGSFEVPGTAGAADLAISFLSGPAGGILANINRWRGQLQLAPTDDEGLKSLTRLLTIGEDSVLLVTLTSADLQTRIVVAIWEKPGGAWFFKLMGPVPTLVQEEAVFSQFLESIVWP